LEVAHEWSSLLSRWLARQILAMVSATRRLASVPATCGSVVSASRFSTIFAPFTCDPIRSRIVRLYSVSVRVDKVIGNCAIAVSGFGNGLDGGIGGMIGAQVADENGSDDTEGETDDGLDHLLGAEPVVCKTIGWWQKVSGGETSRCGRACRCARLAELMRATAGTTSGPTGGDLAGAWCGIRVIDALSGRVPSFV
jgi:hypothetical protein